MSAAPAPVPAPTPAPTTTSATTVARAVAAARPRASHIVRPLDRYVFMEWLKIFITTALGFPLLVVMFDLTDNLDKYLNRHIPRGDIFLSYLYWLPDSMFMVLPAAVLFATVFSIGTFTRYSEITAAKASGISFYRLIAPIFVGAMMATGLGLLIGEVVPRANAKRLVLLQETKSTGADQRTNFVHSAEGGRVYKVEALDVKAGHMTGVEVERKGDMRRSDYPTYVVAAQQALFDAKRGWWTLERGDLHVIGDTLSNTVIAFDSLRARHMTERPNELLATSKAPQDMDFRELGKFIKAMEASGSDVNELRVERMLKITIPVTCMVIFLFGAPLATSTQRGGAAYGVGVSLGTTVVFLMLIQLMKAVGGKGLIPPDLAAWVPGIIFAIIGATLLARART